MISPEVTRFRHEGLHYEGAGAFVKAVAPFVSDGLAAGEAVMVAVTAEKAARLRLTLASEADRVVFVDMEAFGRNPGRLLPAWEDFVYSSRRRGVAARGVAEPVLVQRSPAELAEWELHEEMLNLAFADADDFRLICPYDTSAVDAHVLSRARCTHRLARRMGSRDTGEHLPSSGADPSAAAQGPSQAAASVPADLLSATRWPLLAPPASAEQMRFDSKSLEAVRQQVARRSEEAGLSRMRSADAVLAVSEIAANSIRHGGGRGLLRHWTDGTAVNFEVSDSGQIDDPLVGRQTPDLNQLGGRGIWLAHQLCDLVQLRSGPEGTVMRMQIAVA